MSEVGTVESHMIPPWLYEIDSAGFNHFDESWLFYQTRNYTLKQKYVTFHINIATTQTGLIHAQLIDYSSTVTKNVHDDYVIILTIIPIIATVCRIMFITDVLCLSLLTANHLRGLFWTWSNQSHFISPSVEPVKATYDIVSRITLNNKVIGGGAFIIPGSSVFFGALNEEQHVYHTEPFEVYGNLSTLKHIKYHITNHIRNLK